MVKLGELNFRLSRVWTRFGLVSVTNYFSLEPGCFVFADMYVPFRLIDCLLYADFLDSHGIKCLCPFCSFVLGPWSCLLYRSKNFSNHCVCLLCLHHQLLFFVFILLNGCFQRMRGLLRCIKYNLFPIFIKKNYGISQCCFLLISYHPSPIYIYIYIY